MEIGYLQEVKAIIKSLVLSCPNAITVDALNRDYRATEGFPIPFRKLGYQCIEAFLRSIPDAVQVFGCGPTASVRAVRNEKSDHIQEMVCQQKNTKRHHRGKKPRAHQQHFSYEKQASFRYQAPVQRTSLSYVHHQDGSDSESICNIQFNHSIVRNPQRNIVTRCKAQELPISIQSNLFNTRPNTKSTHQNHQNLTNSCAKISNIGNGSLIKCEKLMRNCKIGNDTCTQRVGKVETPNKVEQLQESRQHYRSKLIQNCIRDANNSEEKQTIIEVDPQSLPKQEQLKSAKRDGQIILDIFQTTPTEEKTLANDMDEAVPEFAANNLVFRIDFPEDTMTFGKKIPPYKLPITVKCGAVIGVFISEIHSPYKFWFHIYKEHHELDTLMLQIERFYTSLDENDFCIPRACICPGQICAALYKGLWHRGEILSSVIKNRTKVLFIDYGTVSDVDIADIKFLLTAFGMLPKQAIRGSLSHIRPIDLHWSQEAIHYFLSMSCDLMLYGQISDIDNTTRTIYMVLCDTNGDQVVQVNKRLVENGFALYDEEWQNTDKGEERLHHLREDFPTFSMLEMGEYPSFAELVDLQSKGIDYEWIIDHNIYHPGRLDLCDNMPDVIRKLPFPLLTTNPFRCDILLQLQDFTDISTIMYT